MVPRVKGALSPQRAPREFEHPRLHTHSLCQFAFRFVRVAQVAPSLQRVGILVTQQTALRFQSFGGQCTACEYLPSRK
jgi:hypothetical protein